MSFLHLADYQSWEQLVAGFERVVRSSLDGKHDACQFVLIDPKDYVGHYGGVFRRTTVREFENKELFFFLEGSIPELDGLSVVWWLGTCRYVGDTSLTFEHRVLVTRELFEKLTPAPRLESVSSYYNPAARKTLSFSSSDSE